MRYVNLVLSMMIAGTLVCDRGFGASEADGDELGKLRRAVAQSQKSYEKVLKAGERVKKKLSRQHEQMIQAQAQLLEEAFGSQSGIVEIDDDGGSSALTVSTKIKNFKDFSAIVGGDGKSQKAILSNSLLLMKELQSEKRDREIDKVIDFQMDMMAQWKGGNSRALKGPERLALTSGKATTKAPASARRIVPVSQSQPGDEATELEKLQALLANSQNQQEKLLEAVEGLVEKCKKAQEKAVLFMEALSSWLTDWRAETQAQDRSAARSSAPAASASIAMDNETLKTLRWLTNKRLTEEAEKVEASYRDDEAATQKLKRDLEEVQRGTQTAMRDLGPVTSRVTSLQEELNTVTKKLEDLIEAQKPERERAQREWDAARGGQRS